MKQKLTFIHTLHDLYNLLGAVTLSLCISLILNDFLTINKHGILFVIFSFIVIFLFRFVADNRKKVMAYFILFSLLFLTYIILTLSDFSFTHLFQNTISYASGNYAGDTPGYYSVFLVFFVSFIISFSCYFSYKIERLRPYFSIPFFTALIICPFYKLDLSKLTLFFILLYLLISLATISQKHNKSINEEHSKLALYLLPFCLFMTVFIMLVPTKTEPLQWKFVFTIIDATSEVANKLISQVKFRFGNNASYNISFTGYADNGELGGGVIPSDRIQLHIKGKKAPQDLYLVGSIYDTYTGHGWEKSSDEVSLYPDYKLDTFELFQALSQSDMSIEDQKDFINIQNAELSYQDIYTQTIFYPQKNLNINLYDSYNSEYIGSNVLFKRIYLKDIAYETKYLTIDYSNPYFIDLCKNKTAVTESKTSLDIIHYASDTFGHSPAIQSLFVDEDMDFLLEERKNDIYSAYTSLPASTPSSIKELAHALTDQYENSYDKSKAIEQYLNSFSYTYIPQVPSEDVDYVEYFLFESKSGFCTYFASSMAVLLRSIDIPARYVEGFVVNYESKIASHTYEIPAAEAHAWCEVYFDDIGWVPFEPTAKYLDSRYQVYETIAPGHQDASMNIPFINENNPEDIPDQLTDSEDNNDTTWNYKPFLLVFLYAIALLLVFFISYYFILSFQRKKRYVKSDEKEKLTLWLKQAIRTIELTHNIKIDMHSPSYLFDELSTYSSHLQIDWAKLKDIYLKQRFSPYMPNEEELTLYQKTCKQIETDFFEHTRFFNRLYFKMFQTLI
jgi:transglutaminase-like putative cysteine protease